MSPIDPATLHHDADARHDGDAIGAIARRTGFSRDAVEAMRRSVARGGGRMAQFDHREFGGPGQWMQGGLLMIGDASNEALKQRVDRLCDALADTLVDAPDADLSSDLRSDGGQGQRQTSGTGAAGHRLDQPTWYPASLGRPDTSGSQNDLRYAWFAARRRLVVDRRGVVTLYDTGDHRIAGVSQQQGSGQTLTFASQHGDIDLDHLPVIDGVGVSPAATAGAERPTLVAGPPSRPAAAATIDPFVALEKLADLHARGVVDAAEFAAKKRELLGRI